MSTPKPPSPESLMAKKSPKGTRRRRKSSGSGFSFAGVRSKIQGLIGSGPVSQVMTAMVPVAEVTGTGFVASALSGYREAQGKDLKVGPVDLRVAAGLGFIGSALYGRKQGFCAHRLNIGTGFLGSYLHEVGFETGSKFGTPDATQGIISGDLDQAGLFGIALTKKAKERKAERKLARLQKREDRIESKIEKVKSKLGDKAPVAAAPSPAAVRVATPGRVVTVPRGIRVFGPRGRVLPSFAARYPVKAQRIQAGWRIVAV